MQAFPWGVDLQSVPQVPRSGAAGSCGSSIFNLKALISIVARAVLTLSPRALLSLHPSPAFLSVFSSMTDILTGVKGTSPLFPFSFP